LLTKKLCLDCEQPIHGRSDKKFCDDNCRNNFHNHVKQIEDKTLRQINAILKRNRNILLRLSKGESVEIPRQVLIEANFNFHFSTHTQTIQQQTCPVIYDMAYYAKNQDCISIQRVVSEKISISDTLWNLYKP
jgi:hypothetical protein